MKSNVGINLILLTGVFSLLAACQLIRPAYQSTLLEQNPLPVAQAESPLPTVAAHLNSANAYQIILRQEESYVQNGVPFSNTVEFRATWVRTDSPYGYNAHRVMTLVHMGINSDPAKVSS